MAPDVRRRIAALFRTKDETSVDLVMTANAVSALALAGLAWLRFALPAPWAVALVPAGFLLLTGCLLYRRTAWIAGVLGSAVIAAGVAFLSAGLLGGSAQRDWVAALLGGASGLAIAGWTYVRVIRMVR